MRAYLEQRELRRKRINQKKIERAQRALAVAERERKLEAMEHSKRVGGGGYLFDSSTIFHPPLLPTSHVHAGEGGVDFSSPCESLCLFDFMGAISVGPALASPFAQIEFKNWNASSAARRLEGVGGWEMVAFK
jgi:hypothetical protein